MNIFYDDDVEFVHSVIMCVPHAGWSIVRMKHKLWFVIDVHFW
jgi:hypothetical protein